MKKVFLLTAVVFYALMSCKQQNGNTQELQNRIDSIEVRLSQTYKPGFGEFMSQVQAHHVKLWFAGQNKNWNLAGFEMDEIKETFDNVKRYASDRNETRLLPMINPPLDSVSAAIELHDLTKFNSSFTALTNTCNACHVAAQFGFNVVKIPDSQTFSNQDFKPVR